MKENLDDQSLARLNDFCAQYPLVMNIVHAITQAGGRAFLVGGAVRDLILGAPINDVDIEVHGVSSKKLEQIIRMYGPVRDVGKSFGVLRMDHLDVDWSLPRADSAGRKPKVTIDAHMPLDDAFRRRDVTINSMGIDLESYELVDPFNGQQDLYSKVLRATDARLFSEDPLRFFRVMQFVGRFSMTPDDELNMICQHMDITQISRERIEDEFVKLFTHSRTPSRGIEWLRQIGRLNDVLPELAATIGIPQDPQYHPEGDVFEHSKQALDAAVVYARDQNLPVVVLAWAALCHDIGKVSTTEYVEDRYRSYGHAQVGARLVKKLMGRITINVALIETVATLIAYHMNPIQLLTGGAKPAAYKRLAHALAPRASLTLLAALMRADMLGRNPAGGSPLPGPAVQADEFLAKVEHLHIALAPEAPLVQGKDLMDCVAPGPEMGRLLKKAYELQIEEGIADKGELMRLLKTSLSCEHKRE